MRARIRASYLIILITIFLVTACGAVSPSKRLTSIPTTVDSINPVSTISVNSTSPSVTTTSIPTVAETIIFPSTPSLGSNAGANNLLHALEVLPQVANHVAFTNWAYIKAQEGAEGLKSTSDADQRNRFWQAAGSRYAFPSFYGQTHFPGHAANWGWDTNDLDWEASLSTSEPSSYILKLRDDFDFSALIANFQERDFATSDYHGITIYSHIPSLDLPLTHQTEFAISNTAVVPEAHLLFLSIGLEIVQAMLDVYQGRASSLANNPPVEATLQTLGNVAGAFISADACAAFSPDALLAMPFLQLSFSLLKAQLAARPSFHPYNTLGIGYRNEAAAPVGLIVMDYPDANVAQTDLPLRRDFVDTGLVRSNLQQTYAQAFFVVKDAQVIGAQIVWKVQPVDNNPARLFMMTELLDMTFATCP